MKRDSRRLGYDSAGPAEAVRGDLCDHLARWQAAEFTDDASVVVSELVSNAVRHGRPPVRVACTLRRRSPGGPALRIEVTDAGPSFDTTLVRARWRHPSFTLEESGRGLFLVDALASRWGDEPTLDGHTVWAVLDPPDG
ncbi:histidine kinase-like protein [Streptomyces sp. BK022]|uniref:ATP-binding protein n=1 Tax=Streptomyces sp. BK022 TaxID=2512123 RepID=UPI0010E8ED68|nr:ATP-binding protein [Streptomyces sp. BK022]RZU45970.1 histidine kinase-like protein [Streptomyces sp. BK022]